MKKRKLTKEQLAAITTLFTEFKDSLYEIVAIEMADASELPEDVNERDDFYDELYSENCALIEAHVRELFSRKDLFKDWHW